MTKRTFSSLREHRHEQIHCGEVKRRKHNKQSTRDKEMGHTQCEREIETEMRLCGLVD